MLKKLLDTYSLKQFLKTGFTETDHFSCSEEKYPATNTICEIVCVTYNNPELIKYQSSLLKKYFKGEYNFMIADNSSNEDSRTQIAGYCKVHNISYISLPKNPYKTGSQSHAASLNWIMKHYIAAKQPAYFGFIDHDIFPIEQFSIAEILEKQPFYGLLQQRESLWYLWAGFCFFRSKDLDLNTLDFMPGSVRGIALDTGGKNWDAIYSKVKPENIEFPKQTYRALREGNIAQSDKLEIIGKWVHSFNGSYWMKVEKKEHLLGEFLKQYM